MSEKNKGGRPATPEHDGTPAGRAQALFVGSVNRADSYVANHPRTSIAARAARCAKAGVDRSVVDAGIAHLEAAISEAKEAATAAYEAPPTKGAPVVAERFTL